MSESEVVCMAGLAGKILRAGNTWACSRIYTVVRYAHAQLIDN